MRDIKQACAAGCIGLMLYSLFTLAFPHMPWLMSCFFGLIGLGCVKWIEGLVKKRDDET